MLIRPPSHCVFLVVLIFALKSIINAQWEKTAPPDGAGGEITAIALHGNEIFVAAISEGGVLRSTDLGVSWAPANIGLPAKPYITSFASCGNKTFAALRYEGIFRYDDATGKWAAADSDLPDIQNAVVTSNGTDVLAETDKGLFRSTDSGATWKLLLSDFRRETDVSGNVIVSVSDEGNSGVQRSIDGGAHWDTLRTLTTNVTGDVMTIFLTGCALTGSAVFAVVPNPESKYRLYVSKDTGATWSASGLSQYRTLRIIADEGHAVAITDDGLYLTRDSGTTWIKAQNGLPTNTMMSAVAVSDKYVFAGTPTGKLFLYDIGLSVWTEAGAGIKIPGKISSLAATGTHVFTVTTNRQLFRSSNRGTSWETADAGLLPISSVISDGTVVYTNSTQKYRSTDNGNGWIQLQVPSTLNGGSGVLTQSRESLFFTLSNYNGEFFMFSYSRYRSDDYGEHWGMVISYGYSDLGVPAKSVTNSACALARYGAGQFVVFPGPVVSLIQNGHQDTVSAGLPSSVPLSLFTCGNHVFACPKDSGIYRLVVDDTSWTAVNTGLTNGNVNCLTGVGTALFAGTKGGVFHSTDNGDSWTAKNSGLEDHADVKSLAADNEYLYALVDSNLYRLPLSLFPEKTVAENIGKTGVSFKVLRTGAFGCFEFAIPRSDRIGIAVYDLAGRKVAEVVNRHFDAGTHRVNWNYRNGASGASFAIVRVGGKVFTGRMIYYR